MGPSPLTLCRVLAGLLFLMGTMAMAQNQPYQVLETPQSTQGEGVEVREFFSYACSHCFNFEPQLAAWTEQMGERAEVVHTPVTFGRDSWALLARAYYAAQALEILEQTHSALFQAIHVDGQTFSEPRDVARFYARVADVSEMDALNAMNSFSVNAQINRAERLTNAYQVPGTPSVGVAGKYLIDVRAAGGQQGMLEVAEQLVAEERGG